MVYASGHPRPRLSDTGAFHLDRGCLDLEPWEQEPLDDLGAGVTFCGALPCAPQEALQGWMRV